MQYCIYAGQEVELNVCEKWLNWNDPVLGVRIQQTTPCPIWEGYDEEKRVLAHLPLTPVTSTETAVPGSQLMIDAE